MDRDVLNGVMGSGVARIVKEKWPLAFREYNVECVEHFKYGKEHLLLGHNIIVPCYDGTTIVNCITQHSYGRMKERYVSYDGVDDCMRQLHVWYGIRMANKQSYIAMPLIGAGLGGGNWGVIEAIIKHRLKDIDVRVYHLEDI